MPKVIKDQWSQKTLTPQQRYKLRHPERIKKSNYKYERTDKGKARYKRRKNDS